MNASLKSKTLWGLALGALIGVAGCGGGNGSGPGGSGGGGQITFLSVNRSLLRADANGQNAQTLVPNGLVEFASISRNGRRIAYQSSQASDTVEVPTPDTRIYVMDSDGTDKRRLTDGPDDVQPAISGDGNPVAFLRDTPQANFGNDIFAVSAAGGGLRRLTQDSREKSALTFSPDGTKVAFIASAANPVDPARPAGLYVINANAASPATNNEQLVVGGANFVSAAFTTDGRIVFVAPDASAVGRRIDVVDADGTDRRTLIAAAELPGALNRISVSPDGSRLVYDVVTAVPSIYTQSIQGGVATRLDLPTVAGGFSPSWGADAP